MCTTTAKDTNAFSSFSNFKEYSNSKDGQVDIANVGGGLNQAINSYFQTKSANMYADYQSSIMMTNAKAFDRAALDAVEMGRDQTAWLGFKSRSEDASIVNDMSYRGIDTNVGSAKSYRTGVKAVNTMNIENARYNAMLQSFGYQNRAMQARHQAEAQKLSKSNEWVNLLMSIGSTAVSMYASGAGGKSGTGSSGGSK